MAWPGNAAEFYENIVDRGKFENVAKFKQKIPAYGTNWAPELDFLSRCLFYLAGWAGDEPEPEAEPSAKPRGETPSDTGITDKEEDEEEEGEGEEESPERESDEMRPMVIRPPQADTTPRHRDIHVEHDEIEVHVREEGTEFGDFVGGTDGTNGGGVRELDEDDAFDVGGGFADFETFGREASKEESAADPSLDPMDLSFEHRWLQTKKAAVALKEVGQINTGITCSASTATEALKDVDVDGAGDGNAQGALPGDHEGLDMDEDYAL